MIKSDDWYSQTFHRGRIGGKNRYTKGHRHHKTEPFGTARFAASADATSTSLSESPKNTIIADKLRELGLLPD